MSKNYSLALGGGAARGLCHIGVLKYIEENNIQINEIAGTSMGAIIGACFALGKKSEEIKSIVKSINFLSLIDFDLKKGVVSGKKIYKLLEKIFGDTKIEDANIPLKIFATDMNTGEKIIFVKGKIVDAVRSSISLPMIFTSFEYYGNNFLDGGLKANLPVLDLIGDNIIAVSAIRDKGKKIIVNRKIGNFEFKKGFFGYNYEILKKTITILMSTNEDLTLELAKYMGKKIILLTPDIGDYEYYDFNKVDEIADIGYEEAKNKLNNL
ncbi:MAG: patatin-like phospholipase family protein [Candidatus Gracilibacteria bacterium]